MGSRCDAAAFECRKTNQNMPRHKSRTIILARVLDEVVLQHAHQDGGQEARQQQHRHAAVDDAEPVDLRQAVPSASAPWMLARALSGVTGKLCIATTKAAQIMMLAEGDTQGRQLTSKCCGRNWYFLRSARQHRHSSHR